jgi:hypothetical protein
MFGIGELDHDDDETPRGHRAVGVTRYDVERGALARCACGAEYAFEPGFTPRLIEPTAGAAAPSGGDEAPK